MAEHETSADIIAEMRGIRVREFQDYADRLEAAHKRDHEYPKAQSLDADKLTGKNISGLVTDLRQIAKYHYARGNIVQGQFARVMADRLEAAHRRERGDCAKLREALMKCQEITLQWQADERLGVAGSIEKPEARSASDALIDIEFVANAALAAPPRNCDLARDWMRDLYAHFQPPASIKREMPPEWVDSVMAFCRWLLAPATVQKGGNDGSK